MKKVIYITLSFLFGFCLCFFLVAIHPSGRPLFNGEYMLSSGGYVFFLDGNIDKEASVCIFGRNSILFYKKNNESENGMLVNPNSDVLIFNSHNISSGSDSTSLLAGNGDLLLMNDSGVIPAFLVRREVGRILDVSQFNLDKATSLSEELFQRVNDSISGINEMTKDENLTPFLEKYGYSK